MSQMNKDKGIKTTGTMKKILAVIAVCLVLASCKEQPYTHDEALVVFVKYATVIGNIHDNPELCQLPR